MIRARLFALSLTLLPLAAALPGCAPRGRLETQTPVGDAIGGRTLVEAHGAPNDVGSRHEPFAVALPCGEARYVAFSARTGGLGASITASVVGAKVARLRVEFLDAQGQAVWERRYDVTPEPAMFRPSSSYAELADGKGRPAQGQFFLRVTGESPHCKQLPLTVALDP